MSRVFCDVTVSLDGCVAGPDQSLEDPLGIGGEDLHRWMFEAAEENRDERDAITRAGAFIMGRNMFGPIRGEWPDESWQGWWGSEPPYHAPVFVLTNHARRPLELEGGTTFHFVTDGIEAALDRARAAAGDADVSVCGGAQTANAYLRADLVDELRLHIAPITLGPGARLFEGVARFGLVPASARSTPLATHLVFRRAESR
ncbi:MULTISPECIES: dihydrofolate reductase family protein [unclassified Microbacterium]|uniref:dihydrofolate reductase family protein n=1 Tax=Microbacterium TaxID=33882 RepID=UPI003BA2439D